MPRVRNRRCADVGTISDLGATSRLLRGGRNHPHVIETDSQERHSAATENVGHHEGGRKPLFSPAQPPYLLSSEPIYVLWDDDPVRSK